MSSTGGHYVNLPTVRVSRTPYRDVIPITALNVDIVTTQILAEMDLSMYDSAMLVFINDGANIYTVTVTTGEASGVIDGAAKVTLTVPAKVGSNPGQNTLLLGPGNMRRFYRATGVATGSLVAARFLLRGAPR
jgi:hypothetical protein